MLTFSSTLLVLVSWLSLVAVVYSLGLIPTRILSSTSGPTSSLSRHSLWWGFAILVLLVLVLGLFFPLTSARPTLIVPALAVASLIFAHVFWHKVVPTRFELRGLRKLAGSSDLVEVAS